MAMRLSPDHDLPAAVAGAAYFIASLFTGHGVYVKAESASLEGARGRARALETKHAGAGRRAMVYAIAWSGRQAFIPDTFNPEGSTPMAANPKVYSKKSNAQRAAKTAGYDVDQFTIEKVATGFTWHPKTDAPAFAPSEPEPAEPTAQEQEPSADTAPEPKAKGKGKGKGKAKPKKAPPVHGFRGKYAAQAEAAMKGALPAPPDFSAPTHARFRKKLDEVVVMATKGDLDGLKAFKINPISSSPKAIARYRDLCVIALQSR